jgi:GNAT superfamily N-acetyltransferase
VKTGEAIRIGDVEVVSAVGHYDGFFEVVGVKKPGGGGCWCMAYRDSRVPNADRPAFMRQECSVEPGPGVLAYMDGEPAGWCSIAPRSSYRRLMHSRTIPLVDDRDAWAAVCFVVRPPFRGRGLMHVLLVGAVEHARRHGADVVEGYPIEADENAKVDVISGYVGTTRLFSRAGFEPVAPTTAHSGGRVRWVMRKELRDG